MKFRHSCLCLMLTVALLLSCFGAIGWSAAAAPVVYGDANGDGTVNSKDIIRLRKYFVGSAVTLSAGADANGDGEVDSKDLVRLRKFLANTTYDNRNPQAVLKFVTDTPVDIAPQDYYGRRQLMTEANSAALLDTYQRFVDGVEAMQTDIYFDTEHYPLDDETFLRVFNVYRNDYPQHFWIDDSAGIAYSADKAGINRATLVYLCTDTQKAAMQQQFEAACDTLLAKVAAFKTDYQKELFIHDTLAKTVKYRASAHTNCRTAYGALVEGEAVCEGYTYAFQYLMYRLGIPCLFVQGAAVNPGSGRQENHCWNAVKIDGQYYHVDVTWDDADDPDFPVMHPYCNVTATEIRFDHSIDQSVYPVPDCTATAANYHRVNGTWIAATNKFGTATFNTVTAALKAGNGVASLYYEGSIADFIDWIGDNFNEIGACMKYQEFSGGLLQLGHEVILQVYKV